MIMRKSQVRGLTYGQVVIFVFGFLVTSALVFLLGVWVGLDIAERRLPEEGSIVRLPAPTRSATGSELEEEEVDRGFYEELKERAYDRLRDTETPVRPPASATTKPRPTNTRRVPPTATTRPTVTIAPSPTVRPLSARPSPSPTRRETGPTPTTAAAPVEEWADAGWTVQAYATTNSDQAIELTLRLRSKGFDAYTVQVPLRGETWYRVRVGHFANREEASALVERLKREQRLSGAYVTPR
jgi:cell division septation protein DedD